MTIQERLQKDMILAQKAADKNRLGAIRWIRDAVQKKAKEAKRDLTEEETAEVLGNLAKKYSDSIEQAKKGGRDDLALHEEAELKVLQEYLPAGLSREELVKLVEETISETGAKGPKDMGNVMKALKPKWAGRADGKTVSEIVKEKLTAKND